jgi:phosphatidylglycerophosphate synthase
MTLASIASQLSRVTHALPEVSMLDIGLSLGILGLIVIAHATYVKAFGDASAPQFERLRNEEGGLLFGRTLMQAGYWFLQPLLRLLVYLKVAPGSITLMGVVLAFGGSGAILVGRFGVASFLLLSSVLCDVLDGMVARAQNSTSERGAVVDALCDRFEEILVLSAIAVGAYRAWWMVTLSVVALVASLMNSYVSAKAEVYRVCIPFGRMRRGERMAWIILGCSLVPLVQALEPFIGAEVAALPLVVCVGVVALGALVSAFRRGHALVRTLNPGLDEHSRQASPRPSSRHDGLHSEVR